MVSSSPGQQPDDQSPEPPTCRIETMTSSDIFHLSLSPLSHRCRAFEMVGRRKRGYVLRPVLRNFKVEYSARKLAPPFKHKVHLPWPSEPGRWQRGPRAVGLTSEFPSPR